MVKIFETFWRASTHYVINAWLEKGGMLPNLCPWCGQEAYRRRGQCIISSMHRWRKFICYLVTPLWWSRSLSKELPGPILGSKNGKNLWNLLEGFNTWLGKGGILPNYALLLPRNLSNRSDSGFPKLISPKAKAGKTLFGPIQSTNPSVRMA